MSQFGSWSVKGVDDRARAAAKEKARLQGITLGDYINGLLLQGHSEAGPRDVFTPSAIAAPAPQPTPLDGLARRIEAVEARSTLAITGIDQSVLGLLARLENTENSSSAMAAEVESMIDELRETQEALRSKVTEIETDDSAQQSLEAMKALEGALGKLATHVYEEGGLAQEETSAIKGRVESGFMDLNDRVEGMEVKVESTLAEAAQRVEKAVEQAELRAEGTSRHLSERFSAIESSVATKLSKVDDLDSRVNVVQDDVSGAITSMESTLTRIQDRLNRAEGTTDAALKALENTFASLDERIETVAVHANPEKAEALRLEFEQRFESLTADLRASVEQSRQQLADEIEQAAAGANPELMGRLEATVDTLKLELSTGEERSNRALQAVSEQMSQMSEHLETRVSTLEAHDPSEMLDGVGEQISNLATTLDERVHESESRSAAAIEQVGEQVATAIKRVQARQETQHQELDAKVSAAENKQEARLSQALANISDRLAEVQHQTVSTVSPVQKAIASLAARLDTVEDFNAPPHAPRAQHDLPEMETMTTAAEPVEVSAPDAVVETYEDAFGPEIEEQVALETEAVDLDFIAGLPDFDAEPEHSADPFEEIEAADTDDGWMAETVDIDYETTSDIIEPEIAEELHSYVADIPSEPEDDPLAELGSWDEAQQETRESDVFASDDAFSELTASLSLDTPDLASNISAEDLDEITPLLEPDEDATDYLARARKAAIAAATDPATAAKKAKPAKGRRSAASTTPKPQKKSNSKVPILAAASVFAIAAAGTGAWVALRGKQDVETSPAPVLATSSVLDTEAEMASTDTPIDEPSLTGVDFAKAEAGVEEMLFEEEGSAAMVEPEMADPIQAMANAVPEGLPRIPMALSLSRAAEEGNAVAQYKWGETRLTAKDLAVGADFIQRAAQQGLPAAQYRLAKLHERGTGVPRDLTEARQWTEKSARGGNIKAMHDLAVFFADGEGGPQSYAAAAEWFRKAADFGVVDSQYNLAVLYENGLGISPSKVEALYWYEIAAANGDASAPGNVATLRDALPLDQAQQAQRRAAGWAVATAAPASNGAFPVQSWETETRTQVLALQTVLNGLGYDAGTPDGIAGVGTRTAIRSFQLDYGLETTGTINAALIEALNSQTQS